ncbi:MAG: DNA gyrase subunit A [Candidatus Pacebacteria bacterium CG10_big_fil_rev_8_21_14_0_10_56_10]|nr:MAG: DNA gyrase subunit A [Candidatus Pacebacteria bacterium CG10_big_fil_rev_8_21_14_0_10_56_10]
MADTDSDQVDQPTSQSDAAALTAADAQDRAELIGTSENSRFGLLKHVSIVEEMEKSYLDYAMSVIVARALPDVRDGLKPVHRRILYSMYKSGFHHTNPYKKSARIIGDVLGRYHPHGDAPVYGALVRLAQEFSMRYPLIDGQGNFGSIDGDSPAAMRYTEARLAKISQELLLDITKNTVEFVDNFDGSLQEPVVLPGKLPNLLLMGSEGIAVGMATKIPPHNLAEVVGAIKAVIDMGTVEQPDQPDLPHRHIDAVLATEPRQLAGSFDTKASIDDIMAHIKGPDFPTAGIIYDFAAITEAYRTGKGRIMIRAKAKIEEGSKGYQIIVSQLPYQVNKARLLMKIAGLVRDKKIKGIRDLNDDSDRQGLQITIDLKRDARPKVVLNKLFKFTDLQTSFAMNMVALNADGVPQLMNIKQVLREYVSHRQLVIVRRTQYDLAAARDRAHILEGLIIALNNLDDVIETIRRSPDSDQARERLMKKFGLSEPQAVAILEMQLKRLAALERQKIEDEYQAIKHSITQLLNLLGSPQAILGVVATEIDGLAAQYGDDRRTKVVKGKVGQFSEEDLVANEAAVITLTESGYVKRLNPSSFRSQSRGGKGSSGVKMKAEDVVKTLLSAETHDTILFFTNQGRVFKLKAYEVPEASRQAKGTAIVNLLNLKAEEFVQTMLLLNEGQDTDKYITLATRKGLVKKTAVKLYQNIRQNGIVAITLNQGDELVKGILTTGEEFYIMLITHHGKSIKFSEREVKASQRDTKGVKGITLRRDDSVIGVEAFPPSLEKTGRKQGFHQLLVVTERGLGKRTNFDEYPVQRRSGMGVKVAEITKKTGLVAMASMVTHQHQEVVISTQLGQTIKIPVTKRSIPTLTRPTQGVILMRLKADDQVCAVALTLKEEAGGPPAGLSSAK